MKKLILFLLLFSMSICMVSCDFYQHVVNKISGHEESGDDSGLVYHEESHETKTVEPKQHVASDKDFVN